MRRSGSVGGNWPESNLNIHTMIFFARFVYFMVFVVRG